MRILIIVCALLGLASGGRGDAGANLSPSERLALAKMHFEEGRGAFERGDYEAAANEFTLAYEFSPEPDLLYNIAQSERSAKHWPEALGTYRKYLATRADPALRMSAEKSVQELERQLGDERAEPAPAVPAPTTARESSPRLPSIADAALGPQTSLPAPKRPLGKRAWFWGALAGGAVVVGGVIALGVALGASKVYPSPTIGSTAAVQP